jgi:hypothetical protein
MYNPFPLFTPTLLLAQTSEAKGKRFFVRQTFPRGKHPELKAAFLFRGYTEEEKNVAEELIGSIPNILFLLWSRRSMLRIF